MVLALEFWTPPFHFLTNASSNLLVLVAKLGVTPQLGLQRHLASKGAPKASQVVPKGSQKVSRQPQRLPKGFQALRTLPKGFIHRPAEGPTTAAAAVAAAAREIRGLAPQLHHY